MAFFSVGGNLGFSLGPIVAALAVGAWGLGGGLVLLVPGLLVGAVLLTLLPYLARFAPTAERPAEGFDGETQTRGLKLLLAIVGLRSVAHMGLFAFIPLFEIARGHSADYGTRLLSLFLFAGAIGTLFGGQLADRFGRRLTLRWSFVLATPLIVVYVLVGGRVGELALVLTGAVLIGTFGVTIVMSQEYMPRRVGMASGLSIGLAIGLGGVAATALGALADAVDLRTAVLATASGPALSLVLSFLLPPSRRPRLLEPEPAPVTI
jgi:FSR family fosmidomycin resistance protein-like MFS transporter